MKAGCQVGLGNISTWTEPETDQIIINQSTNQNQSNIILSILVAGLQWILVITDSNNPGDWRNPLNLSAFFACDIISD